jgi:glycosyltransferase involved in cell wall biosynthesis
MLEELSTFLLAYNEEKNIQKAIESLEEVLKKIAKKYEILVVLYEGHTDKTGDIVKEIARKNKNVRLIQQPIKEKGYGAALRIGITNSKYEYIFYSDADNQFDMNEIPKLIPYIQKYDIVSGYRRVRRDAIARRVMAKLYNIILNILFLTKTIDVDSAFKIYKKKIFNEIKIKSITGMGDAEIIIKAKKMGYRVKELPVSHYSRKEGQAIFQGNSWGFIKLSVIANLIKEMGLLWKDIYINKACKKHGNTYN